MKKLIPILLLGGNLFEARAQHLSQKNDKQQYELRGEVKTLRERAYKPIGKGKKLRKGIRWSCQIVEYGDPFLYFDKSGHLLESMYYYSNDEINYREINQFDTTGNKTGSVSYNRKERVRDKTNFTYDDLRRIQKKSVADSTGKIYATSTYFYQDHIRTRVCLYENIIDGTINRIILKYDDQGNNTELSFIREEKEIIIQGNDTIYKTLPGGYKLIYQFNEKGQKIQSSFYSFTYSSEEYSTYTYNLQGDIIERVTYLANGKRKEIKTYIYEYDAYNNWVNRITYEDKKTLCISEREIVYY